MEEIGGYKVRLTSLMYEHIPTYLHAFVPEVRSLLRVPTLDHEFAYLQACIAAQYNHQTFFYCIQSRTAQSVIGCVEIRQPHSSAGQLYTWIHPSWRSANYFQEAMHLAAKDYFKKSATTTITAQVDCSNVRSWKALKKAGFAHYAAVAGPYEKQYSMVLRNPY